MIVSPTCGTEEWNTLWLQGWLKPLRIFPASRRNTAGSWTLRTQRRITAETYALLPQQRATEKSMVQNRVTRQHLLLQGFTGQTCGCPSPMNAYIDVLDNVLEVNSWCISKTRGKVKEAWATRWKRQSNRQHLSYRHWLESMESDKLIESDGQHMQYRETYRKITKL